MRSVMMAAGMILAVLLPFAAQGAKRAASLFPVELVFVKGGCFQMGDVFGDGAADERPAHEVCVDDFNLGKYEVTQGLWKSVMGSNPSSFQQGSEYPVEGVSWDDAQAFIGELNRRTGKKYRLPTEAEWEYAAKSGGKKESGRPGVLRRALESFLGGIRWARTSSRWASWSGWTTGNTRSTFTS